MSLSDALQVNHGNRDHERDIKNNSCVDSIGEDELEDLLDSVSSSSKSTSSSSSSLILSEQNSKRASRLRMIGRPSKRHQRSQRRVAFRSAKETVREILN